MIRSIIISIFTAILTNFIIMVLLCGGPSMFYEVLQPIWLPPLDEPVLEQLAGKVVLITGANRGLGYGAALNFLKAGSSVILACRSGIPNTAKRLREESGNDNVSMYHLDLNSVQSVKDLVFTLNADEVEIDILVLNAAVMDTESNRGKTGISRMFQVNFLSNVILLEELIKTKVFDTTKSRRVLHIGSGAYKLGTTDYFGPFEELYLTNSMKLYGQTKYLMQIYASAFEKRVTPAIKIITHNPGPIRSNMGTDHIPLILMPSYLSLKRLFLVDPIIASKPLLNLAVGNSETFDGSQEMHIRIFQPLLADCFDPTTVTWMHQNTKAALKLLDYDFNYALEE